MPLRPDIARYNPYGNPKNHDASESWTSGAASNSSSNFLTPQESPTNFLSSPHVSLLVPLRYTILMHAQNIYSTMHSGYGMGHSPGMQMVEMAMSIRRIEQELLHIRYVLPMVWACGSVSPAYSQAHANLKAEVAQIR